MVCDRVGTSVHVYVPASVEGTVASSPDLFLPAASLVRALQVQLRRSERNQRGSTQTPSAAGDDALRRSPLLGKEMRRPTVPSIWRSQTRGHAHIASATSHVASLQAARRRAWSTL
jgi:hypothetical protein